jgi:hypothetical protein
MDTEQLTALYADLAAISKDLSIGASGYTHGAVAEIERAQKDLDRAAHTAASIGEDDLYGNIDRLKHLLGNVRAFAIHAIEDVDALADEITRRLP